MEKSEGLAREPCGVFVAATDPAGGHGEMQQLGCRLVARKATGEFQRLTAEERR